MDATELEADAAAFQGALARKAGLVDEALPSSAEVDAEAWSSGARAVPLDNVERAREMFSGSVWGDVTIVSPPESGPSPFLDAAPVPGATRDAKDAEFAWKTHVQDAAAGKAARRGRFEKRHVRGLELRERGLLVCGGEFTPPPFAWSSAEPMRDELGAHDDPNVRSHGRKPGVFGLEGCGDMCLSLLPSVSGGFAFTQENVPHHMDVLLCLHKSQWRDRLVLEEGMGLEIGANPDTRLILNIMSISGESHRASLELNLAKAAPPAGSSAAAAVASARRRRRKGASGDGESAPVIKSVRFGDSTELETGLALSRSKTSPDTATDAEDNGPASMPAPSALRHRSSRSARSARSDASASGDSAPSHISRFADMTTEEDEDLMATAPIWADARDYDRTARVAARHRSRPTSAAIRGARAGRRPLSTPAAAAPLPRSKLVFSYSIGTGGRVHTETFMPPAESVNDGVRAPRRDSVRVRRKQMFTIGGAATCNMVLPNCPVAIVASIVALDNVFSLLCPSNLSDAFHRGEKLSDSELLFARLTAVHLLVDPERAWGLYDGDALVVRDNLRAANAPGQDARAITASGCDCCEGAELHVRLSDPTERRRLKRNKKLLELNGLRAGPTGAIVPVGRHKDSWVQRAVFATQQGARRKDPGRQVLQDLAVEVRAPVRLSQWDGCNGWRYGDTEAFALEGITLTSDATIGASPLMTLSVKDPRMGRCHASVFRKNAARVSKGAFLMEASRAAGNKALLRLVGASVPPGLGSAATPPHLLLTGEVFRVGASEFKVIGFTKPDGPGGRTRRRQPTREPLTKQRGQTQKQQPSVSGQQQQQHRGSAGAQTPQHRARAAAAALAAAEAEAEAAGPVRSLSGAQSESGSSKRGSRQALSQRIASGLKRFGSMFLPSQTTRDHDLLPEVRIESSVDAETRRSLRESNAADDDARDFDEEDDDRNALAVQSDADLDAALARARPRSGDVDDLSPAAAAAAAAARPVSDDDELAAGDDDMDDDDDEEDEGEAEDAERLARESLNRRRTSEHLAFLENTRFQRLQAEGDARMSQKLDRPGSIALVRHKPNEADPATVMKIASSYMLEDEETEVHIIDNTDKSFGLARIDEYEHVLTAFGLDEGTRGITFPDLESFMVVQCIKGPLLRRIYLIDTNECTIGGSPSCSIAVPNDPLISPLHCRIVFNTLEQHWRLIDCMSRTGTFLRTTPDDDAVLLQPGQRFLVGHTQLRFLGRQRQPRSGRSGASLKKHLKTAMSRGGGMKAVPPAAMSDPRLEDPAHSDDESGSQEEAAAQQEEAKAVAAKGKLRRSYDSREPPFTDEDDPFLAAALRDVQRSKRGTRRCTIS